MRRRRARGAEAPTIVISDDGDSSAVEVVEAPTFSSTFPQSSSSRRDRAPRLAKRHRSATSAGSEWLLEDAAASLSQPEQAASASAAARPAQPEPPRPEQTAASSDALALNAAAEAQSPDRQSYLHIFDRILRTVLEGEAELFSDSERATLSAFSALDRHSRYLYTRIYMRKPAWIRVSSLKYGEPEVVEQSCRFLSARAPSSDEAFLQTEADIAACEDAVGLLAVPELRAVAKARGIKQVAGKTKEALTALLLKGAKQRTVTSFFQKNKEDSGKQRLGALAAEALRIAGPVIRLSPPVAELFERLHLVFFRMPVHLGDDNPMKFAVLASIGQLRFPSYTVARSAGLFASRDDVIQFKALCETGYEMGVLATSPAKKTEDHERGWGAYLAHRDRWTAHLEALCSAQSDAAKHSAGVTSSSEDAERKAVDYWRRHFTPGWALARIVERGAGFAATLKRYADERDVLESLLSQTTYRLGRRGDWYERLIMLHATHLRPKRARGDAQATDLAAQSLARAREVCIRALDDEHVNRVSLHAISRQLRAIEAKLGLGADQQLCHARFAPEWRQAPVRSEVGVRVRDAARRGPSVWVGDDGVPCSVEQLVLWRYRADGYTGVHAENAIATTLFSLLFWDIIFHPLPGVLDTEYQSRPLDMGSESFYFSRQALIEQRLDEIGAGSFADAIRDVYARESGAECVGVSWDLTCDQLLSVATCLGGKGLVAICRVLAAEYRLKKSGFPDLCLWNAEAGRVLFVEVKGPNDKLSDTQRDWLDILLASGIGAEVCLVREPSPLPPP
ncbi:hypothetical protein H4R18_004574 [Coemansia javaensis]|uniref:Fanconi-associated nuclease n=1 Tax=Coemansia javaensis TaxID=2761396 RepID=A0A9W8H598_9FUNG|nr:hypothetical protein H4R18_004574 [Coemansia javaensis]